MSYTCTTLADSDRWFLMSHNYVIIFVPHYQLLLIVCNLLHDINNVISGNIAHAR